MHQLQISAGRLLFRNLPPANTAVVGVLSVPMECSVIEGAAYLLLLSEEGVTFSARPIDAGLPEALVGHGIDVALRSEAWMGTSIPSAVCVRFCSAWPDANIWTVYGASNHAMRLVTGSDEHHAWIDVSAGSMTALNPLADPRGETLGQMLTNHPVWPGPKGDLYTLPQHELAWRPH